MPEGSKSKREEVEPHGPVEEKTSKKRRPSRTNPEGSSGNAVAPNRDTSPCGPSPSVSLPVTPTGHPHGKADETPTKVPPPPPPHVEPRPAKHTHVTEFECMVATRCRVNGVVKNKNAVRCKNKTCDKWMCKECVETCPTCEKQPFCSVHSLSPNHKCGVPSSRSSSSSDSSMSDRSDATSTLRGHCSRLQQEKGSLEIKLIRQAEGAKEAAERAAQKAAAERKESGGCECTAR